MTILSLKYLVTKDNLKWTTSYIHYVSNVLYTLCIKYSCLTIFKTNPYLKFENRENILIYKM